MTSFWKLCVSTTLTVGHWYVASSGSPCVQLFSLLNSNMHYYTHACECRVCWGVMGGVDSGWMVISLLCCNRNRNGPMPNLFIYQRGNHHDKHLSCRFRVESVVIITTKWCLWQWRGYKCRLLINLMTQMSRKEVLIINTLWKKVLLLWGNLFSIWKASKNECVWVMCEWVWITVGWCFLSSQCDMEPALVFWWWWNSICLLVMKDTTNLAFSKPTTSHFHPAERTVVHGLPLTMVTDFQQKRSVYPIISNQY